MHEYEVFMETPITTFSTTVFADTKKQATYQAYKKWHGKELEEYTTFGQFLKYFYTKTVQIN